MHITTLPHTELVVSTFPTVGDAQWDSTCMEWMLTDSDDVRYYGNTPDECYRQFTEALHYLAKAAHHSGFNIDELREFRAQERDWIARHIDEQLPFMATENILMEAVKKGGDRQELHERIRVHSLGAKTALREGAAENDLLDRLRSDPAFAAVAGDLDGLLDPSEYIGRAPAQVDEFLAGHVRPRLEGYADRLGLESEVTV